MVHWGKFQHFKTIGLCHNWDTFINYEKTEFTTVYLFSYSEVTGKNKPHQSFQRAGVGRGGKKPNQSNKRFCLLLDERARNRFREMAKLK